MKKIMLIIFIIFCSTLLFSQTTVPAGNVSGTWQFSGSPYLIEGEISIPDGQILTIEPGCFIEFQGHYKFNVQGQLLAEGTEQSNIIFTVIDPDIGWNGIRFDNTPATNDSSKIIYCIIINGIAEGYPPDLRGGAIYVNSFSKLSITDSRFENNQAIDEQPVGGGGIEKGSGGAICIKNSSNITIKRNLFVMNEGHYGGSIFCSESQISISHCSFTGNNGIFNGGGISTWEASLEVTNCIFYNNSSEYGGGINFDYQLDSAVINCIFSNNSSQYGGAIYSNSSNNGNFTNNVLCNNFAEYGGGICCLSFNGDITNCTIAFNKAQYGGGICFGNYSNPSVLNTIIYNNHSTVSGDQIYLQENPTFGYCLIEEGISGFSGNSSYNAQNYQNCIEEDPMFVQPSAGYGLSANGLLSDFSLNTYSPCIEAGDPETDLSLLPLFDIAGNQRLLFNYVDVGAYEYTSYYADFIADPQFGDVPLTVQFIDESVGLPTFWEWDFENDGTIDSYEQNPIYTYGQHGNYSVSLTSGNNSYSDTMTKQEYINVNYTLVPQFSANILFGFAPLTIDFIDESYGNIISWEWDFENDGFIDSYLQNPTWEYTEHGVYSVALKIFDGQIEDTLIIEDYITILPDNELSGVITDNLVLEADTVNVIGEVTVLDGITLTINPGVTLLFQDHYKLNIQGRLLAVGTEQDSIKFTIADTTGFSNHSIPDGGWHGIRFDNTPATNDSSKIVYCRLDYGKAVGDNWGEESGGAIFIDDFSKILISNCTLINNYAEDNGGAIYDAGGIKIENSIISNNKSGEWGGGIYSNGYPSGQYTNLIVSYNSASEGGGLYIRNNPEIINCKITNNESSGIYVDESSPRIINTLVCNNEGEGIYIFEWGWEESNPKITNCTIANNGDYGIKYHYYEEWWEQKNDGKNKKNITPAPSGSRSITVRNNLFSGNTSGSIFSDGPESLTYCAFSDDLPSFAGTGCISTEAQFTDPTSGVGVNYNALEADWSIQSNSMCINRGTPDTTGLYLPEFDLAGNLRVFQGIEPRTDIGSYEFQGEPDQIPDIYAYPRNFDFYLCSIDSFSLEKSFTISNIGFADLEIASIIAPECFLIKRENDAEFDSVIEQFTINADSTETINIVFHPNAEYVYSDEITITSNDPDENIVTIGVTGIGDIYPVVYGNIFEDTTWDSEIIKVTGNITVEDGKTLTITPGTNVKFMNRYQLDVQGRILAEGTEQDSIIFTSKNSDSWWNGIKFDNTTTTNDSSKFVYCKFSKSFRSPGGAFYIFNFDRIKFDFCTFINNKAVNYGGAIYVNYSNISISNSRFIANEALADWDYMWSSPGCGAGLYIKNSNIELINCIIRNNHAHSADNGSAGGGIYIYNSEVLIQNSQINNNLSSYAVGIYSSSSNTKLINCELSANGSQALGLYHSNLDLVNSIISQHNNENQYTISARDSTNITFINTIMYDNEGQNVRFYPSENSFYADYSCIEGGESSIVHVYNGTVDWQENNIEEDPLFIDPENGDFHLQSNSPCINAGTSSGWISPFMNITINELLGYEPVDDNYDIGCYEYRNFMLNIDDLDFGEIPYNIITSGVQIEILNLCEEDIVISSIESSDNFLIKLNEEDQYNNHIGEIEISANFQATFFIACRPMDDGLIEGEVTIYSKAIPTRTVITVSANVSMVDVLKLYNNFPNPFNPETTIKFSLPQESKAELTIYNIKGQKVRTLVNAICETGINTTVWNGTNDAGNKVGTGVYFYKLDVDDKTIKAKKMLLLK